jgi:hypothetical protein
LGRRYAGFDVNGLGMRKAATRETTGPLKAWLHEHRKNPYPTKAEKIMLAIITKMTLIQVRESDRQKWRHRYGKTDSQTDRQRDRQTEKWFALI